MVRPRENGGIRPVWLIGLVFLILVPSIMLHNLHHHASHHHAHRGGGCPEVPKIVCPRCDHPLDHHNDPPASSQCPTCKECPAAESHTCPQCPTPAAAAPAPCPAQDEQSDFVNVEDSRNAAAKDWGAVTGKSHEDIVMLTFGNSAVWPMLSNWIANMKKAGMGHTILVGALDQGLVDICHEHGVNVEKLDGQKAGMENGAYLTKSGQDLKKYKQMAALKIQFALDLLKRQKANVLISDSDTAWLRDPRPFFESGPFGIADVLVSTDCIDTTADEMCRAEYCGCIHVALNTGIVFLRNTPKSIEFTSAWHDKVLDNEDLVIRDQAAFNIVMRGQGHINGREMQWRNVPGYDNFPRQALFAFDGKLKLGILPLLYFQNGHSYFTQKLHERRNVKPYVVHATYQYGDGARFPFGKRQRFREAGLWLVDPPEYYAGNFLAVSWAGSVLPETRLQTDIDSRLAVDRHFKEDAFRRQNVRNAFALAKLLNRTLIMPRTLCYVDHMWKEMRAGRFGGAYDMALPFECPTDYLFELPRFFDAQAKHKKTLDFREPQMLNRLPSVAPDIAASRVYVKVVGKNANLDMEAHNNPPEVHREGRPVKVELVQGKMNDKEVLERLKRFDNTRLLELSSAHEAFCGWEDSETNKDFDNIMNQPLNKRWEFKYMETGQKGQPAYKYWVPYDQFEGVWGFNPVSTLESSYSQCRKG